MAPTPFVSLGRVLKTHGLKGEVAVAYTDDLPFLLEPGLEVWFVPPPLGVRGGAIESVRTSAKGPIVKVRGIDSIETAQGIVGTQLVASEADLPEHWEEAPEQEDPVGLSVTDVERGPLGEVVALIVTGANDVWVIEGPLGEVLLPVIDDVVLEVDHDARTARVRALPGLLPEEKP
jgi:16S rRNA processing protein RimM